MNKERAKQKYARKPFGHRRILPPLLIITAFAEHGAHAETKTSLRLSLQSGWDSNARRDYSQTGTVADAAFSFIGVGNVSWQNELWRLRGQYEIGGRKFTQYNFEDTLIQSMNVQAEALLSPRCSVGLEGRVKDRRGGSRDYTDLFGGAFVECSPDSATSAKIRLGAERFLYRPAFAFSYWAPEVDGEVGHAFSRRHFGYVYGNLGFRRYNDVARGPSDVPEEPGPVLGRRTDTAWGGGFGYRYRAPVQVNASYGYFKDASNGFGQTYSHHRLSLGVGTALVWKVLMLLQVTAQLSRYPDGIFLSPQIILLEDAENSSSASLKLVRPVSEHWDVELGYAGYFNRLPSNGLTYWRHYAWVGVTWRL